MRYRWIFTFTAPPLSDEGSHEITQVITSVEQLPYAAVYKWAMYNAAKDERDLTFVKVLIDSYTESEQG